MLTEKNKSLNETMIELKKEYRRNPTKRNLTVVLTKMVSEIQSAGMENNPNYAKELAESKAILEELYWELKESIALKKSPEKKEILDELSGSKCDHSTVILGSVIIDEFERIPVYTCRCVYCNSIGEYIQSDLKYRKVLDHERNQLMFDDLKIAAKEAAGISKQKKRK